jgi:23S rRNA G2445 N2-methylase RlmL
MKGAVIVNKGLEGIAKLELKELIGATAKVNDRVLVFEAKMQDFERLVQYMATARRILILIEESHKDLINSLPNIDFSPWLTKKKTFRVVCRQVQDSKKSNEDLQADYGEEIIKNTKKNLKFTPKVNLERPDVVFYLFDNGKSYYFGVDVGKEDLGKRQYKIFHHPSSLDGPTAYALVRLAGWKTSQVLLDPFCGSGTIPIEAALFAQKRKLRGDNPNQKKSKLKILGFDILLHNVMSSKKNAKIAGIDKAIDFSKVAIEWLDTKFAKGEADCIVTHPPAVSAKRRNQKDIEAAYKEFFYQADYVLNKKGIVVLISESPDSIKKYAREYKFVIKDEISAWSGKLERKILIFRPKIT